MNEDQVEPLPAHQNTAAALAESMVNTVREPMLVLDAKLTVLQANQSFCQHFRINPQEAIGHKVYALGNGQWDIPALRDLLENILPQNPNLHDFEVQHSCETFGQRTMLINARKLDPVGLILLAIEDTTGSTIAQDKLQNSEEVLRILIEHAPTGLAMFDRDMRYLFASQRWKQDYRIEDRELVGISHYEVFPEISDAWKEFHRRGIAGEVLRSEADRFDRADGSMQWVRWEIRPWRQYGGQIGGIIIFAEEITDRMLADERVRNAALFPEENPFPVIRVRDDGMVLFANRASAKLLKDWECCPGGMVPEFIRHDVAAVLQTGERRELEVRCDEHDLSLALVPIAKAHYVNFYGRDITERKLIENKLRDSETRYRELVERANSAIIRWKADGTLTFINDYARRYFGYSNAEIIGRHVNILVPNQETTGEDLSDLFQRIVAHPEQFQSNVNENICRDGRRVWMAWANKPIFDADGQTNEILAIGTDITELKQAEDALRESEERLRLALDAAFVISFEWDIQRNEVRRYVSHEVALPTTPEEKPATFEDVVGAVHPDDRELFRANVSAALESDNGDYENEFRLARADGEVVWLYERGSVKRNQEGQPIRLIGLSQDISSRKLAEAALRESGERFHQLADAMPQLVWTANPSGEIDYFNERHQEFMGFSQLANGTWEWSPVLHPEDVAMTIAAWHDARRNGTTYQVEHRVQRADGSYAWFLSRAKPIRDKDGRIVKWYGTATDIDDLKSAKLAIEAARKSAEEASQAKSDFLANMSHEIRTPMTVFFLAIEQLLQIETDPACLELLDLVDKSSKSLRALVDDILDFSRIEASRVQLVEEPTDPRFCVHEIIKMFTLPAKDKNLRLTESVAPDLPPIIFCDSGRLKQVLINLVSNAIKFTSAGGIDISVRLDGNALVFAVADTGSGIPEAKRHLIFKSFSQVDTSFHRRHGGSGLGLAICKGLVELMGGMIAMQNREGGGSIFSFTIPVKTGEALRPTTTGANAGEHGLAAESVQILLVEDDPLVRDVITMGLARRGWHVETTQNGREAVEKWRRGSFDAILMDLQMPEMNGLEATRMIRSGEAVTGKHITIIGITAYVEEKALENCIKAGMDLVLSKPLHFDDLCAAINDSRTN